MSEMDNDLTARIKKLEEENASLRQWQSEIGLLMNRFLDGFESINARLDDMQNGLDAFKQYSVINRYRIDSLPYEMADPDYDLRVFKPLILDASETRRRIAEEKMSISRFGDGEFASIVGMKRWNFQGENENLGSRLKDVLSNPLDGMLTAINPMFYSNLFFEDEKDADGVRAYMRPMVRRLHADLLNPEYEYGDALFNKIASDRDVAELKAIWNNRNVILIEGHFTRAGVGNDLFDNAGNLSRILCPSENAFDRYDEILNVVCSYPKDSLYLLALGPTASVLAYDMHREGFQAVDIGHIDLYYEKYRAGADSLYSVKIPYKYCSSDEIGDRRNIEETDDPVYQSQIVERLYDPNER